MYKITRKCVVHKKHTLTSKDTRISHVYCTLIWNTHKSAWGPPNYIKDNLIALRNVAHILHFFEIWKERSRLISSPADWRRSWSCYVANILFELLFSLAWSATWKASDEGTFALLFGYETKKNQGTNWYKAFQKKAVSRNVISNENTTFFKRDRIWKKFDIDLFDINNQHINTINSSRDTETNAIRLYEQAAL